MKVVAHHNFKAFNRFAAELYQDETGYVDNKSSLLKLLCRPGTAFFENSVQEMICVMEGAETLCQAVLIKHQQAEELSVGFFDALPHCQQAVSIMLEYAQTFALANRASKIVVGLEGHCNHAVGIQFHPHLPISFGESYGKSYYHDYFDGYDKVKLVSFKQDKAAIREKLEVDAARILLRNPDIVFESPNFSKAGFAKAIQVYTDLNNEIFHQHRYYYPRSHQEDLELFSSMKPLLKPENLIFVKKAGSYIGYVLWYPDFNQLVRSGGTADLSTYLRYKIGRRIPTRGKVVEIGLQDKYKRTGIFAMLFLQALKASHKKCDTVISSWILEENLPSELAAKRYANQPYKEFFTYEKNLEKI